MNDHRNATDLYENIPKYDGAVKFCVSTKCSAPTFRMHWHEDIEIQYVIEGVNIARCGNDIVEIPEGSFYIINSTEIHQSIGGKRRHAFIQFPPSLLGNNKIILKRVVCDPYLSEIMQKMLAEQSSGDELSELNIQGYAFLLITHLCRNYAYDTVDERAYGNYSEKRIRLNKCIKYMHDNYNKDIPLSLVADMANVSKYHFCNMFKEFTGQTFKEYHNNLRISKAVELLSATDIPVTEIAFLCGFNDSNYFSRKFHQITGKTPLAMREELKEKGISDFKLFY